MSEERPGFINHEEWETIRDHCQSAKIKDVLEIGTYCGKATSALLRGSTGLVFSVDPLAHPAVKTPIQAHWIRKLAEEFRDRLVFIPAWSHQLVWERPVSLVMLDGDHRRSSVIKDLRMLCPAITEGGSLILDDAAEDPVREMWEYYRSVDRKHTWTRLKGDRKLQIWRKKKRPQ
jgi:predicted O-methyltransferase YrrM